MASNYPSGYSWESNGSKQVVWLGQDLHIYELHVGVGGAWTYADLTYLTSGQLSPLGWISLMGYGWNVGQSKQVIYNTYDDHIHELYCVKGGAWKYVDLIQLTGAPPTAHGSPFIGYGWDAGESKQVVYQTADGHIHELYVAKGGAWGHVDLTAMTGAPTGTLQDAYSWEAGRSKQVVFTTSEGHIHELYVGVGGAWGHADLTQMTGAPTAVQWSGNIVGYGWDAGGSKQIVFGAADKHIHELYVRAGGAWGHADLTQMTGAPLGLDPGTFTAYSWEAGRQKQVAYIAVDGHIHELFVGVGDAWEHADLSQLTGASPNYYIPVNGYAWNAGRSKQVVLVLGLDDGHIREMFIQAGSNWAMADLTYMAGAPLGPTI
jgi:hypothetical protein